MDDARLDRRAMCTGQYRRAITNLLTMSDTHQSAELTAFYKTISAKGKVVMAEKRARGEVMHKAPLGYKNTRDEDGRSILVIDPETYPLVQRAKELRAQGMSIRKICAEINSQRLRFKRSKLISPASLFRALAK